MNLRPLVPPALVFAALPARAADAAPTLAAGIGQMVLGLGVVIVLLFASLWAIKRLSAPRGATAGLKVLGGISIGSRERVVLVEVADQVLVLGVSSASVTTLHTLEASALRHAASAAPPADRGSEFSRWLKGSMERRNNAG